MFVFIHRRRQSQPQKQCRKTVRRELTFRPVVISRGNAWERCSHVKIPLERMGTAFPLLSYGENAYILLKVHDFAVQNDVFLTLKYGKTRWRPRPDPLIGWGGDTPPRPHLAQRIRRFDSRAFGASIIGAFGASNFAPSALNFGVPIVVNLRNDHWRD